MWTLNERSALRVRSKAGEADTEVRRSATPEARSWAGANRLSSGALPALTVANGLADPAVTRGPRGPRERE